MKNLFYEEILKKMMIEIIYCIKCNKNSKISKYYLHKTLVLSIICDKCDSKDDAIFKEEWSIEILECIDLINSMEEYQTNI